MVTLNAYWPPSDSLHFVLLRNFSLFDHITSWFCLTKRNPQQQQISAPIHCKLIVYVVLITFFKVREIDSSFFRIGKDKGTWSSTMLNRSNTQANPIKKIVKDCAKAYKCRYANFKITSNKATRFQSFSFRFP